MLNSKFFIQKAVAAAAIVVSLTACNVADMPATGGTDEELSQPVTLNSREQAYANSTNGFALSLFRTMASQHGTDNVVVSPVSVACALGMLNDGATGQTRQELLSALGFGDASTQQVNDYFRKLTALTRQTDADVTLHTANAVFVQKGVDLLPDFAADLNRYYQAVAEQLDFQSPQTVAHINAWSNSQTKGMIPVLLNQMPEDAVAILLNALYFNGKWALPFDREFTTDEPFTAENGTARQVPMMHMVTDRNEYYANDDFQALRMAYGQGDYAMTLLLPRSGKTVGDIASRLTADAWAEVNSRLAPGEVVIGLPRFTAETAGSDTEDLTDVLRQSGIVRIFTHDAELPNMFRTTSAYASKVIQKAKIAVTEEGTEGAAVTEVDVAAGSAGGDDGGITTFYANRPFLYLITERTTGIILFVGMWHG